MPALPRALALALLALVLPSCDAVQDVVDPQPDLEIAVGVSTLEVADGFEVVYTVVASNRGPADATDVVVSIPVPDATAGFSAFDAPPGTDCGAEGRCSDDEVIEWPLGTLAAGQSRTLSVGIPIEDDVSGYISSLSVSADSPNVAAGVATRSTPVLD